MESYPNGKKNLQVTYPSFYITYYPGISKTISPHDINMHQPKFVVANNYDHGIQIWKISQYIQCFHGFKNFRNIVLPIWVWNEQNRMPVQHWCFRI